MELKEERYEEGLNNLDPRMIFCKCKKSNLKIH